MKRENVKRRTVKERKKDGIEKRRMKRRQERESNYFKGEIKIGRKVYKEQ